MKRLWILLLAAVLLCACGKEEKPEGKKWDCSVTVVAEDPTCIVYSNERLETASGSVSFQNRNAFPVHLYLYRDGFGELVAESEMDPGGVFVFLKIEEGVEYTVGFHADQPEGTPITIMAYDGNHPQEPYVLEESYTNGAPNRVRLFLFWICWRGSA